MDLAELFIAVSLAVSFILLYARRKKWNTNGLRWVVTGTFFLIGMAGVVIDKGRLPDRGFYFLFIPFIYNCFDRWFKNISEKKYGRDFYLYLRYSGEINDGLFARNPHVKPLDKIFSFSLLFIIIGLMMLAVGLCYNNNH